MELSDLMAMAGQFRDKIAQAKTTTEQLRAHGEAGGGMVKVTLNGLHQVLQLDIEPAALQGPDDLPLVASLVRSAINQAVAQLAEKVGGQVGQLAADLGINPADLGGMGGGGR